MPNSFSKEERVAFENILEGFEDALVISDLVSTYKTDATEMERTSNVIWRPQPYIMTSYDGLDQTLNFGNYTQLSVPATLGFQKSVPWQMSATELRDALQEGRLKDSAYQRLASDINVSLGNVAALQGTLVVKRTVAATGFDDIAECDAVFNEQGIAMNDRKIVLSSRDYNKMAKDLAGRQNLVAGKTLTAYETAYVGMNCGFETFKLDYNYRLTAAAGVTVTVNGANQYYTPKATSQASTGETANVDNRYQNLTVTVTSGTIKVGDAFTIASVNAVHHITKGDTGQLKTFRVTGIVSGAGGSGVIQISPPIISATGGTQAEKSYQNVSAVPANGAAITWLNTVTAPVNPFWHKDALEIIPGRYAVPKDGGPAVLTGATKQGIEVMMMKSTDINTTGTKFRLDSYWGVCMKQPEMAGMTMFSQT